MVLKSPHLQDISTTHLRFLKSLQLLVLPGMANDYTSFQWLFFKLCFGVLFFYPQTMAPWPELENAQHNPNKYIKGATTAGKDKETDKSKCLSSSPRLPLLWGPQESQA